MCEVFTLVKWPQGLKWAVVAERAKQTNWSAAAPLYSLFTYICHTDHSPLIRWTSGQPLPVPAPAPPFLTESVKPRPINQRLCSPLRPYLRTALFTYQDSWPISCTCLDWALYLTPSPHPIVATARVLLSWSIRKLEVTTLEDRTPISSHRREGRHVHTDITGYPQNSGSVIVMR
ncbi:hypothetical protein J6590_051387 [Homalodisca vitripennis]|nr:hypothetical protein J6590_051387 [Homalodisca vitripennis]